MPSKLPPTPTSPTFSAPSMQAGTVVLLLSALLGLQPITTDLYLPARSRSAWPRQ